MIRRQIIRLLESKFASGAVIMTVGNGLRLLLALLSFAIVAGSMGTHQFGTFATVVSMVGMTATFSGWGSSPLIMRRVSRDASEYPAAFATGIAFLALSAPLLTICALVAIPYLVTSPIPITMILFIALSDIVLAPTNTFCASCFQSAGRPMWNAWMNVVFSAVRLAAALVWVYFTPDHTALSWSYWYCGSAALVAALSMSQVLQKLGRPVWRVDWSEWKEGLHFSILFASLSVFREIDRPVIAAVSSLSTVGVYAAAFRVADAAVMPVRAVMYSTFGHFFRVGAGGPGDAMKFALKILPVTTGIGIVAGVLIAAVAPFAPVLLGRSYAGTTQALFILAPLPALYAAFYLAADVLVGSDRTWLRNIIQLVAPVVDVALCLVLVPAHGASGAAVAALVGHASAVVMAWGTVWFLAKRPQPSKA